MKPVIYALLALICISPVHAQTEVQGPISSGSTSQPRPVIIGGYDGTNIRTLKTDSSGRLTLDPTSSVGGAVTQSGLWLDQIMGVDGATVASNSNPFPVSIRAGSQIIGSVTQSGTWTVTVVPPVGALTDRSGTITSGGTAQQICAANATRKYLLIQNTSSVDMWVSFTTATPTAAGAGCYKIAAGGSFESSPGFVSNQACYVFCATTSATYSASEN
jgi:hypothetical protein